MFMYLRIYQIGFLVSNALSHELLIYLAGASFLCALTLKVLLAKAPQRTQGFLASTQLVLIGIFAIPFVLSLFMTSPGYLRASAVLFGVVVTLGFFVWGKLLAKQTAETIAVNVCASLALCALVPFAHPLHPWISTALTLILLATSELLLVASYKKDPVIPYEDEPAAEELTRKNKLANGRYAPFIETSRGPWRRVFMITTVFLILGVGLGYMSTLSVSTPLMIGLAFCRAAGILFFAWLLIFAFDKPTFKRVFGPVALIAATTLFFLTVGSVTSRPVAIALFLCLMNLMGFYYMGFQIVSELLLGKKTLAHQPFAWLFISVPPIMLAGYFLGQELMGHLMLGHIGALVVGCALYVLLIAFMVYVLDELNADDGIGDLTLLAPQDKEDSLKQLPGYETLSPREKEVAALLLQGKSRQNISTELSISTNTVKIHAGRVYQKLDVASQIELIKACD